MPGRRAGTIFQQGGQGQKLPVRHKRGINFLTPISNFRGSVDPLTRTSHAPGAWDSHSNVVVVKIKPHTKRLLFHSL